MADVDVTLTRVNSSTINTGTSSGSRTEILRTNTVAFTFINLDNTDNCTVSGFSGSVWTSTSNETINDDATSPDRTVLSNATLGDGSLSVSSGTASGTYFYTIVAIDTTPNGFDNDMGADKINQVASSTVEFSTFTPDGYNAETSISIAATGGGSAEYQINGGTYTSSAGNISPGQSCRVRITNASTDATTTTATLTIGGVDGIVQSTTDGDQLPDSFDFTDLTNQELGIINSNIETITGLTQDADVEFTSNPGNVFECKVGGGAFKSTNLDQVGNNETVQLRHSGLNEWATTASCTIRIGSATDGWVSDTWSVTTRDSDITPANFNIGFDREDVPLNSTETSSVYTVAGMGDGLQADLTRTGSAEFNKNSSGYTSTPTTVVNDDTVQVRIIASPNYATDTTGTVTIGTETENFSARTLEDTVPASYTWTDQTGRELNEVRTSNTITVTSITTPVTCTITNTNFTNVQYNKASAGYVNYTAPFSIANNETLILRGTTSGSYSTEHTLETDIGSPAVSDTWSVTTRSEDTTADAFDLGNNISSAAKSTTYDAPNNPITVSGLDTGTTVDATLQFTGGGSAQYRRNGDATWRSTAYTYTGTDNGDTFDVQITSSSSDNTGGTATLDIGGVSDTWTVTTATAGAGDNPIIINSNFTTPLSQRDMMRFFGGDDVKYPNRPDNLRAYIKEPTGDIVPDVSPDNDNIVDSGSLSLESFVGSSTEFGFTIIPSNLTAIETAYSGGGPWELDVQWDTGDPSSPDTEWTVGFSPGMWSITQYKYDISNLVAEGTGTSTGDLTFTPSTYANWDSDNNIFGVSVSSNNANTQKIYSGTVTFYARNEYDTSQEITATANFSLFFSSNE